MLHPTSQQPPPAPPDVYGKALLRSPAFWVLWVTYGVAQGAALLVINNLASAVSGCRGGGSTTTVVGTILQADP